MMKLQNASPRVRELAVSQFGNLWQSEPHRALCGDVTRQGTRIQLCARKRTVPDGLSRKFDGANSPVLNPRACAAGQFSTRPLDTSVGALFDDDASYAWHGCIGLFRRWEQLGESIR